MKLFFGDLFEDLLLYLEERMTFDQLFAASEPKRIERSRTVRGPPLEVNAYKDAVFHSFNFKSFPSTTGLRHQGYIKFYRPKTGRTQRPLNKLECEVDCECPDFRYRWAWAIKQRGSSKVGPNSLNQAWNRAPRITNPSGRVSLCKHLLATRNYIYGLLSHFPEKVAPDDVSDLAWKLDQLTRHATKRWINYPAEMDKAKELSKRLAGVRARRNVYGPQPAAPPEPPSTSYRQALVPTPLPKELAIPPSERGRQLVPPPPSFATKLIPPGERGRRLPTPTPTRPLAVPPGQRGRTVPPAPPPRARKRIRGESIVVNAAPQLLGGNNDMKNQALIEAQALLKEVEDELADIPETPEPSDDDSMGGPPDRPDAGMGGISGEAEPPDPDEEALELLRTMTADIGRMADEIAPAEEPGMDGGPGEELPPEDLEGEGDIGVPPPDEEEMGETMPIATGA